MKTKKSKKLEDVQDSSWVLYSDLVRIVSARDNPMKEEVLKVLAEIDAEICFDPDFRVSFYEESTTRHYHLNFGTGKEALLFAFWPNLLISDMKCKLAYFWNSDWHRDLIKKRLLDRFGSLRLYGYIPAHTSSSLSWGLAVYRHNQNIINSFTGEPIKYLEYVREVESIPLRSSQKKPLYILEAHTDLTKKLISQSLQYKVTNFTFGDRLCLLESKEELGKISGDLGLRLRAISEEVLAGQRVVDSILSSELELP